LTREFGTKPCGGSGDECRATLKKFHRLHSGLVTILMLLGIQPIFSTERRVTRSLETGLGE
jgi:hypothetical protein